MSDFVLEHVGLSDSHFIEQWMVEGTACLALAHIAEASTLEFL